MKQGVRHKTLLKVQYCITALEVKWKEASHGDASVWLPQSCTISVYLEGGPRRGEDFCTNGLLARNTASYQTTAKVMFFFISPTSFRSQSGLQSSSISTWVFHAEECSPASLWLISWRLSFSWPLFRTCPILKSSCGIWCLIQRAKFALWIALWKNWRLTEKEDDLTSSADLSAFDKSPPAWK